MLGVQNLNFAHAIQVRPSGAGIANGEPVVGTGRQLELRLNNEIVKLCRSVEHPAPTLLATEYAFDGFTRFARSLPTGQILTVKEVDPACRNSVEFFGFPIRHFTFHWETQN